MTLTEDLDIAISANATATLSLSNSNNNIGTFTASNLDTGTEDNAKGNITVSGAKTKLIIENRINLGSEKGGGIFTISDGGKVEAAQAYLLGKDANHAAKLVIDGTGSKLTLTQDWEWIVDDIGPIQILPTALNISGVGTDDDEILPQAVGRFSSVEIKAGATLDAKKVSLDLKAGGLSKMTIDGTGTWVNGDMLDISGDNEVNVGMGQTNAIVSFNGTATREIHTIIVNEAAILEVNGSTLKATSSIAVGIDTTESKLEISNAGKVETPLLEVGIYDDSEGTVTVTGVNSELKVTDSLNLGVGGSGLLFILNSAVVKSKIGNVAVAHDDDEPSASVIINNGQWLLKEVGSELNIGSPDMDVSFTVKNDGFVETTGTITKDKQANVKGDATLKGLKIVSGGVFADFIPGTEETPIATLTLDTPEFDASVGTTLQIQLGENGNSDRLAVTGDAEIGGNVVLTIYGIGISSTSYALGTTFTILTVDGTLTGTFSNLPEGKSTDTSLPALQSGYYWFTHYTDETSNNSVTLTVACIPTSLGLEWNGIEMYDTPFTFYGGTVQMNSIDESYFLTELGWDNDIMEGVSEQIGTLNVSYFGDTYDLPDQGYLFVNSFSLGGGNYQMRVSLVATIDGGFDIFFGTATYVLGASSVVVNNIVTGGFPSTGPNGPGIASGGSVTITFLP